MQSSSSSECDEIRKKLAAIAEEINRCTRCPLHQTRTKTVPGEGDPCQHVVLIGEAPGQNEDLQGRPFVGAAGQLLTQLLTTNGIQRESVFITNVVKCRPPENRDPLEDEIQACLPFLQQQLEIIKPRVIVTLGRHSTRTILGLYGYKTEAIMSVRGKTFRFNASWGEVKIFPTLHPAAALYNPRIRSVLEADFREITRIIKGEGRVGQHTLDSYL
ncbi:MAG: type-4 uracil-DNA glycosylase [Infirmifilum sp.]